MFNNREPPQMVIISHFLMAFMCNVMVSALDSGSSGPGTSPGRDHCAVFLGKTLYFHSASLYPGEQMGTSIYAGGNPVMD